MTREVGASREKRLQEWGVIRKIYSEDVVQMG